MATYKAVMRAALEYASSMWLPLASSTSINELQVMQNWEPPQDAHKTQTYNICMTKHSYFPYTRTYSSTRHNTNKNTISITPLTQTHNILQHSKAKTTTLSLTTAATQQTFQHTITTTDIKQTCAIYIHLLSLGT